MTNNNTSTYDLRTNFQNLTVRPSKKYPVYLEGVLLGLFDFDDQMVLLTDRMK